MKKIVVLVALLWATATYAQIMTKTQAVPVQQPRLMSAQATSANPSPAIGAPTNSATMVHPQLAALVDRLNSVPTYGGEFQRTTVPSGRRRAVASSSSTSSTISASNATAQDTNQSAAPSPFNFAVQKLQLDPHNPDLYVIPGSVTVSNLGTQALLKSVDISVNGNFRGHFDVNVNGLQIDDGISFNIPVLPSDAGKLTLVATITPADPHIKPDQQAWLYDVPTCRVPEILSIPNGPHDTRFATFVGQVHGLAKNLMPSSAIVVWTQVPWADELTKLQEQLAADPTLSRDQWSGVINVSTQSVRYDKNSGLLKAGDTFWPGTKGVFAFIIPSTCGRYSMSNVETFYTDEAPRPQTPGMSIEIIRSEPGKLTESRVTINNAPRGGWIVSYAQGTNGNGWWSYSSALSALVEGKEGPQYRNFEYFLFNGFRNTVYAEYFSVNDAGYIDLMLDAQIDNVNGTFPCYFCTSTTPGGKG